MASLKKHGNKYYARYYTNGKQVCVPLDGATTLQVAKEKLRQLESSLFKGEEPLLQTKTPLSDILEKYIHYRKAHSTENSVKKIVSYLRLMFGEICDSLKIKNANIAKKAVKRPAKGKQILLEVSCIEHLTTKQVSEFLSDLVTYKGVAAKTVNHYRQILLTMCNWSMTEGGVTFPASKNPVSTVKRYREIIGDIRYLRLRDITEQLEVIAGDLMLQCMVAVYIYGGLRREEALWLTPEDIDFDTGNYGIINIRTKHFDGKMWVPKTKVCRIVPISRKLRMYLDLYLETRKPNVWLFYSTEGHRWDPDNFSAHLRDVNNKAGLPWSCLDYRHTFGTQLASKGLSLLKISTFMGNSPETCRKHYTALTPESLYDSVEFDESVKPVPEHAAPEPPPSNAIIPKRPPLRLVVNNR